MTEEPTDRQIISRLLDIIDELVSSIPDGLADCIGFEAEGGEEEIYEE